MSATHRLREYTRGKTSIIGMIAALIAAIICMSLSGLVLRDAGNITVFDDATSTSAGAKVALRVYKPAGASDEAKAPAIVFAHGLSTNKESYAQYGMELAKRGFVVVTPDLINHGSSDVRPQSEFLGPYTDNEAYGMYAAVRYVKDLPYVQSDQIGVAGHSVGGQAANNAVRLDNEEATQSIQAVYLVSSEPVYKDQDQEWANVYGNRDVGVYYTTYDHVYFTTVNADGTPVKAADWLTSDSAKSLFSFGDDPADFAGDQVVPGQWYEREIDGRTAVREVTQANEIHPQAQDGDGAVAAVCDFFQASFEAPRYRLGANQTVRWYQLFNVLGLFAVLAFAINLIGSLTHLKLFASLRAGENASLAPPPADRPGKIWFWGLTIANCAFAFVSISLIFKFGLGYFNTQVLAQQPSNIYAFWALANGLFMFLTSFVSYRLYARKHGATMRSWGLRIPWRDFGKSLLVVVIALLGILAMVELANRVFRTDFRYYLWGLRDVPMQVWPTFLAYLPFFLVFGLSVSIALNSAYHCRIAHEKEWVNDLFFAVMNMVPALLITVIGYWIFAQTKVAPTIFGSNYTFTYTINAIPVFPVIVVFIRRAFKRCNNPYIPGLLAGALMCWFQTACSVTIHAFMYFGML
ncbi:alpha/beta hydrolase [Bifidobacterium oedipodis]|uniref:AB hydrolase-1 domain-containing protein n=1 Tax=Bifidobacterium oedipodis TaxID=2675322 RepID=A0A7Y0EPV3_9BIFI|nr:alpha/beta fold hydrolase [Bifidobacterium sp. DSM 109957]NMM94235.1 hypothetical protein [Bifidobacterium sp. DSM 109957]